MKEYKVIVTNGLYEAPCLYVEVPNVSNSHELAIKAAREKSGLSRFPQWSFLPRLIK